MKAKRLALALSVFLGVERAVAEPLVMIGADDGLDARTRDVALEQLRAELAASGFEVAVVERPPDNSSETRVRLVRDGPDAIRAEVYSNDGAQRVRSAPATEQGARTIALRVAELLRARQLAEQEAPADTHSTAPAVGSPPFKVRLGLGAMLVIQPKGLPLALGPGASIGHDFSPRLSGELRLLLVYGSAAHKPEPLGFHREMAMLGGRFDLLENDTFRPFAALAGGIYQIGFGEHAPKDKSGLAAAVSFGAGARFALVQTSPRIELVLRGDGLLLSSKPLAGAPEPTGDAAQILVLAAAGFEVAW